MRLSELFTATGVITTLEGPAAGSGVVLLGAGEMDEGWSLARVMLAVEGAAFLVVLRRDLPLVEGMGEVGGACLGRVERRGMLATGEMGSRAALLLCGRAGILGVIRRCFIF